MGAAGIKRCIKRQNHRNNCGSFFTKFQNGKRTTQVQHPYALDTCTFCLGGREVNVFTNRPTSVFIRHFRNEKRTEAEMHI